MVSYAHACMGSYFLGGRANRGGTGPANLLGEGLSTLHTGQGPTVMAFLRDAALSLLHRAGIQQVTARLREHAQDPTPAVALVIAPPQASTRA
ncbi:MAG: hypothetical protein ACRDIE_02340 [Chloroflexota bacterium]